MIANPREKLTKDGWKSFDCMMGFHRHALLASPLPLLPRDVMRITPRPACPF